MSSCSIGFPSSLFIFSVKADINIYSCVRSFQLKLWGKADKDIYHIKNGIFQCFDSYNEPSQNPLFMGIASGKLFNDHKFYLINKSALSKWCMLNSILRNIKKRMETIFHSFHSCLYCLSIFRKFSQNSHRTSRKDTWNRAIFLLNCKRYHSSSLWDIEYSIIYLLPLFSHSSCQTLVKNENVRSLHF